MIRLDPLDDGASLADGNESTCNAGAQVQSLGREDPLEKEILLCLATMWFRLPPFC